MHDWHNIHLASPSDGCRQQRSVARVASQKSADGDAGAIGTKRSLRRTFVGASPISIQKCFSPCDNPLIRGLNVAPIQREAEDDWSGKRKAR